MTQGSWLLKAVEDIEKKKAVKSRTRFARTFGNLERPRRVIVRSQIEDFRSRFGNPKKVRR